MLCEERAAVSISACELVPQTARCQHVRSLPARKTHIHKRRESRFFPLSGRNVYSPPIFGSGIIERRSCGKTIVIGRLSWTFSFGAG